jgi:hypothetical protein
MKDLSMLTSGKRNAKRKSAPAGGGVTRRSEVIKYTSESNEKSDKLQRASSPRARARILLSPFYASLTTGPSTPAALLMPAKETLELSKHRPPTTVALPDDDVSCRCALLPVGAFVTELCSLSPVLSFHLSCCFVVTVSSRWCFAVTLFTRHLSLAAAFDLYFYLYSWLWCLFVTERCGTKIRQTI